MKTDPPISVLIGLGILAVGLGIMLTTLFLEPREPRPVELQIIYDTAARHYQTGRAAELAKLYGVYDEKLFKDPGWMEGKIQESADKMIAEEIWRERSKIRYIGICFILSGIAFAAASFAISKFRKGTRHQ